MLCSQVSQLYLRLPNMQNNGGTHLDMTSTRSRLCSSLGESDVDLSAWVSSLLGNLEHRLNTSETPERCVSTQILRLSRDLGVTFSMTNANAQACIITIVIMHRSQCSPASLPPTRTQESMVADRKTSLLSHPQSIAALAFGGRTVACPSVACGGRSRSSLRTGLFDSVHSEARPAAKIGLCISMQRQETTTQQADTETRLGQCARSLSHRTKPGCQ